MPRIRGNLAYTARFEAPGGKPILKSYPDRLTGGEPKPTIGYGTTRYPDGRKVSLSDHPCSRIEAKVYLEYAMRRVLEGLQGSGAVTRPPTLHQAAALESLAYNIGVGVHDGIKGDLADSTLLARFNAGDIAGAADQFLVWNKAHVNGNLVAIDGLTRRREAERRLFLTPDALAA
jgi:GH24 family phage-related lysozyme (muramidase)